MLKVAICGASGYTGAELLRLLSGHPKVKVTIVTSERSAGLSPAELYGQLQQYSDLKFEKLSKKPLLGRADVFFMALPHGESQDAVNYFYKNGKKVVDLSADFRLKNHLIYQQWYKISHKFPGTLKHAVYGLPELYRKKIKKTRLVANPGCYPTGAILGLFPLMKEKRIDKDSIIIDAKSGTSGAGRKADVATSFCSVNEDFRAYAIGSHRHTPEINQELLNIIREPVDVNFIPHLLPIDRGLLCTIYAKAARRTVLRDLHEMFSETYAGEPFVRVLPLGSFPNLKSVRGTNLCEMGIFYNDRTATITVVTAIDNLIKGASGQAIQCMNIMMGFKETTALQDQALCP
jgi:N-acetyl-gamma-glutamyl-phosphate reductase